MSDEVVDLPDALDGVGDCLDLGDYALRSHGVEVFGVLHMCSLTPGLTPRKAGLYSLRMANTESPARTDNGTVWTHDHDDVYKTTNERGDVIHALTSDFEDDDQED